MEIIKIIQSIIKSYGIKVFRILEWTIKLWLLTTVIPITISIVGILSIIIGMYDCNIRTFMYNSWINYYLFGNLIGIVAWRIHLGILFICFLINIELEMSNENYI